MVAEDSGPHETRLAQHLPLPVLMLFAWLVPGLGHLLLGRRLRAAIFFCVVVVGFALGLVLEGELMLPHAGDPLSYLATIATVGNGLLFFIARSLDLGRGVVTSAGFEFGNTFLLTAGMMNLLLILDTHDIAVGKKDW
jgi:hypothetical protein